MCLCKILNLYLSEYASNIVFQIGYYFWKYVCVNEKFQKFCIKKSLIIKIDFH